MLSFQSRAFSRGWETDGRCTRMARRMARLQLEDGHAQCPSCLGEDHLKQVAQRLHPPCRSTKLIVPSADTDIEAMASLRKIDTTLSVTVVAGRDSLISSWR